MVSTTRVDTAGARGEGLEPSITGPEPVVLPITPPPNGWAFRLAERPGAGVRPPFTARPRCIGAGTVERCLARGRPGPLGNESDSEVLGMQRWSAGVIALAGVLGTALLPALGAQAGTPGMVVKVTPSQGLKAGQMVTVSGRGLPKSSGANSQTW